MSAMTASTCRSSWITVAQARMIEYDEAAVDARLHVEAALLRRAAQRSLDDLADHERNVRVTLYGFAK